ncbi:ankyrin repeat domain-containing protein [bacterium]|nr:ankyrin repeat domain-containing protein [bacterium]
MKYIRILCLGLFLFPFAGHAAGDFNTAAQLLSAAKNADIQQVQALVNNGADINYVDSTGLSLVCTALMNNDLRAAQILQMYGADASKCDRQIKQYNNRTKPKTTTGGLFSGLSSAQSITLAAAGAAVVVGGLLLLTDVFDPGNDNNAVNNTGGNRPGGDGVVPGDTTSSLEIPVGPAYFDVNGNIDYTVAAYHTNLSQWDPAAGGIRERDFNYFRPTVQTTNNFLVDGLPAEMQNYLLMMHGYSSFANGYMGQTTIRDEAHKPVKLSNNAGGGKPVAVALITENGVSPTGSIARTDVDGHAIGITWADSAAATSNTYTADKYLNFAAPTTSDGNLVLGAEQAGFDFSGSGTALNPFARVDQNALGKIVAGWESGGRATGDLFGFIPNGQLGVYRTGGGTYWSDIPDATSGAVLGTVTKAAADSAETKKIEVGDTITLNGKTYKISLAAADSAVTAPTITVGDRTFALAAGSTMLRGKCQSETAADCENVSDIAIYQGTDGYYYVNSTGGATVDAVYVVGDNNIYAQKESKVADIKTYQALYNARSGGGAVMANATLNPKSRLASYTTMRDLPTLFNVAGNTDKKTVFGGQIDLFYDQDATDATSQGGYANSMFNNYNTSSPILVNPAGEFAFGSGTDKSTAILDATFENYAPALYDSNLEHLFMTIVAVGSGANLADVTSIGDYENKQLYLAGRTDADGNNFFSRKCGIAGVGINGIDPWCFAAAGPTPEMATASAAGAVAAVKGAFSYMNNKQIFNLLALTADGYLLGSDDAGTPYTTDTLAAHLQDMYILPAEYNASQLTAAEYLRAFADVYGYGMINLERATTPGKKLYYYDGNKIVSASGNAFWRSATGTTFRTSAALNPRAATVSASVFDMVESVDGSMRLPRVWKNELHLNATDARGLYMGDVLGELRVRDDAARTRTVDLGGLRFSMATSDKAYADQMGGLDTMALEYDMGRLSLAAGYQRNFTDGAARFDGNAHPILGLASNVTGLDATYNLGRLALHGRAFSGAITDDGLLENDPTVSAQYAPARLGRMAGASAGATWHGDHFSLTTDMGTTRESDTVLGAATGGLLSLGGGDTRYVDVAATYRVTDDVTLRPQWAMARTHADAAGEMILGATTIESDAASLGLDMGGFSLTVSRPLGVRRGALRYAHAEYDVVDADDDAFDLVIRDAGTADMDLRPDAREWRFAGSYRRALGPATDGAVGFIYRVNPNHTRAFGNEGILMFKIAHRMGI